MVKNCRNGAVYMFADYHVHSYYSDDSVYRMEDVVRDAIQMNMNEICFTDHVDYGVKEDWDCGHEIKFRGSEPLANVDYPHYIAEIKQLQQKYADKISIKAGLEFGMQVHTVPLYEKLFKQYPFDFIILSVHQIDNKEFWTQDYQKGRTQKEYNERYYQELLELVKIYKNYSVLGHLDLITRYDLSGIYPFEKIKPVLAEIFKIIIADGKGLEVNTSSYRYGLSDMTPSKAILKLYRDFGGKIITIGSDSHKKEHLGAHFTETVKILRELGFDSFCTFDHMQQTCVPLNLTFSA